MRLIAVYCVIVTVGEFIAFGLGLLVERIVPTFSMLIFMSMFFGVLWGGWPVAVYITERWLLTPDDVAPQNAARP